MSPVVMESPVEAQGRMVAALSRSSVGVEGLKSRLLGWGRKEPVALLLADGAGIRAFDPGGGALSEAEIEALCPGAWAAFHAASQHLRG
ncbi:MAG: hypothetical protein LCH92_19560 [Proteobacteria bacterium]|nr:hypothetical protein [Pseudomonadota bacterium]